MKCMWFQFGIGQNCIHRKKYIVAVKELLLPGDRLECGHLTLSASDGSITLTMIRVQHGICQVIAKYLHTCVIHLQDPNEY